MAYSQPARTPSSTLRAAGLLALVAIAALPGYRFLAPSFSTAESPVEVPDPPLTAGSPDGPGRQPLGAPDDGGGALPRRHDNDLGEADGAVPDGTTVFDDGTPGVAKLDPALLAALRRAATAAAHDGVTFIVNSGWRSRAYQEHLLRQAVARYGSLEEAARWVATADTSPHVSGDAVDLEPAKTTAWLSEHGAAYGLCPIYRNEPWHYERRPEAVARGCPPIYADPTHDPRMRP